MFKKLKDLFAFTESFVDNGVYTNYDEAVVKKYKEQYPDAKIEEARLPDFGKPTNAMIKKWYYNEGERVTSGDIICVLETDKLTMELEAYEEGYIYFRQRSNQTLNVGQVLCIIASKPTKMD